MTTSYSKEAYTRGFRVGLATHDEPVVSLGTVTQTLKAIERFIDESGLTWQYGFWDGLAQQSDFEKRIRTVK